MLRQKVKSVFLGIKTFADPLPRPVTLFKKRPWHSYFPANFTKFHRTHFLQNTSAQLLEDLTLKKQGTLT